MRNIRLEIEYDGTGYCGWQVQNNPKKKSIQETLEKALRKVLREKVKVVGSGRTDAGVHALAQTANFKVDLNIPVEKLQSALNANLPDDIVVTLAEETDADFHSRFSAKSKLYRYSIINRSYPSALLKNRAYFFRHPLDIRLMRREARVLLGRHDFSSFQSSGSRKRDAVKTIKKIRVAKNADLIHIDIEADGFLYNMARNIVGTLIEVGRKKLKRGDLKKILAAGNRKLAGPTAPAQGLCLLKARY